MSLHLSYIVITLVIISGCRTLDHSRVQSELTLEQRAKVAYICNGVRDENIRESCIRYTTRLRECGADVLLTMNGHNLTLVDNEIPQLPDGSIVLVDSHGFYRSSEPDACVVSSTPLDQCYQSSELFTLLKTKGKRLNIVMDLCHSGACPTSPELQIAVSRQ